MAVLVVLFWHILNHKVRFQARPIALINLSAIEAAQTEVVRSLSLRVTNRCKFDSGNRFCGYFRLDGNKVKLSICPPCPLFVEYRDISCSRMVRKLQPSRATESNRAIGSRVE